MEGLIVGAFMGGALVGGAAECVLRRTGKRWRFPWPIMTGLIGSIAITGLLLILKVTPDWAIFWVAWVATVVLTILLGLKYFPQNRRA